jgi:Flp pilus assembly protein TadD
VLALQGLAFLLVSTDRAAAAIPLLRRALEQAPDLLQARTDLVLALGGVGKPDEALAVFREADGGGQASLSLVNAMARVHHENGAHREARVLLQRSLALDPTQPKVRALLETLETKRSSEDDGG